MKSCSTNCSLPYKVGDIITLIDNPQHEFRHEFFNGTFFSVTHIEETFMRIQVIAVKHRHARPIGDFEFEWVVRPECWSDFKIFYTGQVSEGYESQLTLGDEIAFDDLFKEETNV